MLCAIKFDNLDRTSYLEHMPYAATARTVLLLKGYMPGPDGLWMGSNGNCATIIPLSQEGDVCEH
jgi:hypothetical protein